MARRTGTRPKKSGGAAKVPPAPRSPALAWIVGLAGVLLVKLTVVWQLHDHPLLSEVGVPDTTAYVSLAKQILAGDFGLGPGLYYVSPLYIYFVASGLTVGTLTTVLVIQAILGTTAVGLMVVTARVWFGTRAAVIAGVLATFTGLFTFYESVLLQAALDPFLTSLALCALTMALMRDNRWWLLAGAAFAVQTLNRPNVLLAALSLWTILALTRRWRPVFLMAIGLSLGFAPVLIRNVVVTGQWSLVSSHGGLNLLIGNGPGATGLFRALPDISPTIEGQARDTRRVAERALGRTLTDGEVSAYFSGLARRWIFENPGAWLRLMAIKTWYVLNRQHIALPLSYPFYAFDTPTLLRVLVVGPWLLIPLGLAGIIIARPDQSRTEFLIWASFIPAYVGAVALFFVTERYRLPLLVPFVITSAGALDRLLRSWPHRQTRTLSLAGGLVAVLAIGTSWPTGLTDGDGRGEERIRMAAQLARMGRVAEAERWLDLALTTYPYTALAEYRVGVELGNAQQWAPSAVHLEKALKLDPAPRVELALGQVLAGAGRDADAVPHLRRAIEGDLQLALNRYDLAVALANTGDHTEALRVLKDLVPPSGTPVDKLLEVGRLAMELQGPAIAEPLFARAVSEAPDFSRAQEQLGLALMLMGRNEQAAIHFLKAVSLDSRSADSMAGLAHCEAALGHASRALEYADAALRLDPAQPIALRVKARGGR